MISRLWRLHAAGVELVLILWVVLWLGALPALAEVPRHAHAPADSAETAAQGQQHANQAAADHGQMQHAMEGKEEQHQHPSPQLAPPGSVRLDERLGSHIPLDLTFRDATGQPVTLAELIDKPTVIAPVYYRCPNVCHYLQGDLARVLPKLKLQPGEDYQVISLSFDEREQPKLAARSQDTYFAAMKGDFPTGAWRFLTGDREDILALTDAAGYYFQRVGHEFLHPVAFFVVSADGKIVRYLHGTHVLPKDLTLALYEAREGRVGTTIRKVVQFCFSFDPEQKTYVFNVLRVSATVILATLVLFLAFLVWGGKKSKRGSKS